MNIFAVGGMIITGAVIFSLIIIIAELGKKNSTSQKNSKVPPQSPPSPPTSSSEQENQKKKNGVRIPGWFIAILVIIAGGWLFWSSLGSDVTNQSSRTLAEIKNIAKAQAKAKAELAQLKKELAKARAEAEAKAKVKAITPLHRQERKGTPVEVIANLGDGWYKIKHPPKRWIKTNIPIFVRNYTDKKIYGPRKMFCVSGALYGIADVKIAGNQSIYELKFL